MESDLKFVNPAVWSALQGVMGTYLVKLLMIDIGLTGRCNCPAVPIAEKQGFLVFRELETGKFEDAYAGTIGCRDPGELCVFCV